MEPPDFRFCWLALTARVCIPIHNLDTLLQQFGSRLLLFGNFQPIWFLQSWHSTCADYAGIGGGQLAGSPSGRELFDRSQKQERGLRRIVGVGRDLFWLKLRLLRE